MNIEDFLAAYDPQVQNVCFQLRQLVKELLPDSEEILYEGWKNISYGKGASRSDKDLIVYIAPFKDSVNLGFFRGAILPDPKSLLKGTGKMLRHVKVKSMEDANLDDVKELVVEAKFERLGVR